MKGNATIKPASTGFLPANQDEKAITNPEIKIFAKNNMISS